MPPSQCPVCLHNVNPGCSQNAERLIAICLYPFLPQAPHYLPNKNIPCLSQPWPPKHSGWKLSQKVTGCRCTMTMSFEISRCSQSTPRFRKYYAIIQLKKELQPRKVRNRTGNKSLFSPVHKFFFQLNLYHQPRVWLYEPRNGTNHMASVTPQNRVLAP